MAYRPLWKTLLDGLFTACYEIGEGMSLLFSPFFRPRADRNGLCVRSKHFDYVRIKTYATS